MLVTDIAQLFFPFQANGSLITRHHQLIGSELIGQSFTDKQYFWGRPSATQPFPYHAANSSGSNFGPTNPYFLSILQARIAMLKKSNPSQKGLIPVDLVTASGSGLDPDISPLAAHYQAQRIAKARGIPEKKILLLIENLTKDRTLGILGEPRLNVLQLNLALDNL
jgi:K+-transporting ATPase ATPase C chain